MSEGTYYSGDSSEFKVFVGGLSVNCDDQELREYLMKFGTVVHCEIIKDKSRKSKGYGFATFSDEESVRRAVGKQHFLKGKCFEIRVQVDSSQNSELLQTIAKRKIFVSNLKQAINENDLARFFSRFGTVEEVLISRDPATQLSKGFGFVVFVDPESAKAALYGQSKRNVRIKNHDIIVKEAIPKKDILKQRKISKNQSLDPQSDLFFPDHFGEEFMLEDCYFDPFQQVVPMKMGYQDLRLVQSFAHPALSQDIGFEHQYFIPNGESKSRSMLYPAPPGLLNQQVPAPFVPQKDYCPIEVELVNDMPEFDREDWGTGSTMINQSNQVDEDDDDESIQDKEKETDFRNARTFYETTIEQQESQATTMRKPSFFSSVIMEVAADAVVSGLLYGGQKLNSQPIDKATQKLTNILNCGCEDHDKDQEGHFNLSSAFRSKACRMATVYLNEMIVNNRQFAEFGLSQRFIIERQSVIEGDLLDFRWSPLASRTISDKDEKSSGVGCKSQ